MEQNDIKKLLIDFEKTTSQLKEAIQVITEYTKAANEMNNKINELITILGKYSIEDLQQINKNVEKFNSTYKDQARRMSNNFYDKVDGFNTKLDSIDGKQNEIKAEISGIKTTFNKIEKASELFKQNVDLMSEPIKETKNKKVIEKQEKSDKDEKTEKVEKLEKLKKEKNNTK